MAHHSRLHYMMHCDLMQAAAFIDPQDEAHFQALCRWSASLGYILKAHLEGCSDLDDAAKVWKLGCMSTISQDRIQHRVNAWDRQTAKILLLICG